MPKRVFGTKEAKGQAIVEASNGGRVFEKRRCSVCE